MFSYIKLFTNLHLSNVELNWQPNDIVMKVSDSDEDFIVTEVSDYEFY